MLANNARWTIAYRKPRANRFARVTNWSGTWSDAEKMAGLFLAEHPELQVYYVGTLAAENAGLVQSDDRGNILVDSGKRVRMTETGVLSDELIAAFNAEQAEEIAACFDEALSLAELDGVDIRTEYRIEADQAREEIATLKRESETPAKKMDRYGHWALSQNCVRGGSWLVQQGHADYCAEYGHATYTTVDRDGVKTVHGWCPRCGDAVKTPEQAVSELDTVDQNQAVDVMRQVVDNGREDLLPVLDLIDAAECKTPCGENSAIPCVSGCPRCSDSAGRCDECVLAWLVSLFRITGDVRLNALPVVPEFDCV